MSELPAYPKYFLTDDVAVLLPYVELVVIETETDSQSKLLRAYHESFHPKLRGQTGEPCSLQLQNNARTVKVFDTKFSGEEYFLENGKRYYAPYITRFEVYGTGTHLNHLSLTAGCDIVLSENGETLTLFPHSSNADGKEWYEKVDDHWGERDMDR